jgi:hypothetical protein
VIRNDWKNIRVDTIVGHPHTQLQRDVGEAAELTAYLRISDLATQLYQSLKHNKNIIVLWEYGSIDRKSIEVY